MIKTSATILCLLSIAATNETYTVFCPEFGIHGVFTNCIKVIPNHEKKNPPCTLVVQVFEGKTNEFHAWATPVYVITNK